MGMSTIRYFPPNGTAGFDLSFVRGNRRVPFPLIPTTIKEFFCHICSFPVLRRIYLFLLMTTVYLMNSETANAFVMNWPPGCRAKRNCMVDKAACEGSGYCTLAGRFVSCPCASTQRAGNKGPVSHQKKSYELARARKDFVVVTPTASGKTLCYNLPVLQTLLEDRRAGRCTCSPQKLSLRTSRAH
jgi:hypothetical protein